MPCESSRARAGSSPRTASVHAALTRQLSASATSAGDAPAAATITPPRPGPADSAGGEAGSGSATAVSSDPTSETLSPAQSRLKSRPRPRRPRRCSVDVLTSFAENGGCSEYPNNQPLNTLEGGYTSG